MRLGVPPEGQQEFVHRQIGRGGDADRGGAPAVGQPIGDDTVVPGAAPRRAVLTQVDVPTVDRDHGTAVGFVVAIGRSLADQAGHDAASRSGTKTVTDRFGSELSTTPQRKGIEITPPPLGSLLEGPRSARTWP